MEELTERQKKFRAALKGKKQPTEKQRDLAKKIALTLSIPLPKNRTKYDYCAFIDEHIKTVGRIWEASYGSDGTEEMDWYEHY